MQLEMHLSTILEIKNTEVNVLKILKVHKKYLYTDLIFRITSLLLLVHLHNFCI